MNTKKTESAREFLLNQKKSGVKLSKLAEWYLSDDPNKLHIAEVLDMRAVLR